MPITGVAAAGTFFILSFIFPFTQGGSDFGLVVWVGLILFCLAYGQLIRTQDDALKLAPLMTLAFGLIHGFGFAGLLSDIGLPPDNVVGAVFGFNIGIEVGQLLVFVPLVILGPYVLEELPTPPVKWADIAALMLTIFGVFLFVSRTVL